MKTSTKKSWQEPTVRDLDEGGPQSIELGIFGPITDATNTLSANVTS